MNKSLKEYFSQVDFGEQEIYNELSIMIIGEYQEFINHEMKVYIEYVPEDNYVNDYLFN